MKPGSTTTSRKPRKRARNGASSPKPKKFCTRPSAGKVTLTLFWDKWGVILEHYMPRGNTDQYNVCRSPKESPVSCNQVQTMWTSEYRCFAPTWQCSVLYCPFNCCNNPRSVLWVSSTSIILARPRPQWLSCFWTTQRGDGMQVFQVRRRGAAGGAWVPALSAKRIFF